MSRASTFTLGAAPPSTENYTKEPQQDMVVDEENSTDKVKGAKEGDKESSSYSDTFKEDEGKRQQLEKKRKKKEKLSELSLAIQIKSRLSAPPPLRWRTR
eukprot:6898807-Karenia_brevis.AAC.1